MTYEELIKRLKELDISDKKFDCAGDFNYVRMLVTMYERSNDDYSLDRCFDDFIMWEEVEQQLRKFIDDRDAHGLKLFAEGYDFDDDVYHVDNYGHVEHINGEVMNDLIENILHYLGDDEEEEIND